MTPNSFDEITQSVVLSHTWNTIFFIGTNDDDLNSLTVNMPNYHLIRWAKSEQQTCASKSGNNILTDAQKRLKCSDSGPHQKASAAAAIPFAGKDAELF